ncbi:hypothetical protein Gpo141_00001184 [Globisporangium polare]
MSSCSSSSSRSRMSRQLVLDDVRDLHRKQLLTSAQLHEFERRIAALPEPTAASATANERRQQQIDPEVALVLAQVRALYQHELEAIIAEIRVQHNEKQQDTFVTSDFVALATGGVMGALNAWMRPAAAPTPAPAPSAPARTATSLWASAFDAAQASLNVVRKRRLLEHLQIKHLSGDESACEHVVLCINGFMTQGSDPSRNWKAWFGDDVVVYAVLWEAGDVDAWNDFCAHVNDQLSVSSMGAATSALITHFTGNPWHKAQDQAEQVGALLAQVLASQPTFCRGRKVTLFGHSLGGAVIYSVFQEIARLRAASPKQQTQQTSDQQQQPDTSRLTIICVPSEPLITNAVCFAGAFIPRTEGLENISKELAPTGKFLNVFSSRDGVLSKLFWALQLHASDPIAAGCASVKFPAACLRNCANVDVTPLVPPRITNQFGHNYGMHMDDIIIKVRPHLSIFDQ